MMKHLLAIVVIASVTAAAALSPGTALAKKGKLSPAKIKQYKKTTASFESCRKQAVGQLKQGTITQKKFEIELRQCKENFPGADLYVNCKKAAIKTAKSKNMAPDKAVQQCRRYMVAASFDAENPLPFFVEAGKVFFAGVGLNQQSTPVTALNPPNFDCARLKTLARNPAEAQYLLFGNHPGKFAGLSDLKPADLARKLGIKKPAKDGTMVAGLGKVLGNPKDKGAVMFFPSAACDFESELGDIFAGISTYYLIDSSSSTVTPYFGIAYFRQAQDKLTTEKAIQGMVRNLGGTFKTFNKGNNVTFIAADNVTETDDESDPKNLCDQPRVHRFVGVVQGRKDKPSAPEYMIVANIKNLCDFGDRLGKRLTN
jgi:hypothetical protein